ncbi:hypothetical protein VNI00_015486 [Paramarasmius palmivorus]|uniref:Uncharacterized protein n=1 Tax=Paramarasmius palmivorus TaxID=297713 RepID=A0AAW0BJZ3_9AGAR
MGRVWEERTVYPNSLVVNLLHAPRDLGLGPGICDNLVVYEGPSDLLFQPSSYPSLRYVVTWVAPREVPIGKLDFSLRFPTLEFLQVVFERWFDSQLTTLEHLKVPSTVKAIIVHQHYGDRHEVIPTLSWFWRYMWNPRLLGMIDNDNLDWLSAEYKDRGVDLKERYIGYDDWRKSRWERAHAIVNGLLRRLGRGVDEPCVRDLATRKPQENNEMEWL